MQVIAVLDRTRAKSQHTILDQSKTYPFLLHSALIDIELVFIALYARDLEIVSY